MKRWLKYILIGALIGLILGAIIGPIIIVSQIECPVNELGEVAPCMGSPMSYMQMGAVVGVIGGILVGLIMVAIKKRRK